MAGAAPSESESESESEEEEDDPESMDAGWSVRRFREGVALGCAAELELELAWGGVVETVQAFSPPPVLLATVYSGVCMHRLVVGLTVLIRVPRALHRTLLIPHLLINTRHRLSAGAFLAILGGRDGVLVLNAEGLAVGIREELGGGQGNGVGAGGFVAGRGERGGDGGRREEKECVLHID